MFLQISVIPENNPAQALEQFKHSNNHSSKGEALICFPTKNHHSILSGGAERKRSLANDIAYLITICFQRLISETSKRHWQCTTC